MRYNCPICDCWFGTEIDLGHHLKAHEVWGDDLPCMLNRRKNKVTIDKLIAEYRDYLDNYGRGYQNKISNFNELSYVFSYDDPEWKKLSADMKAKANYQCQICGTRSKNLETHHKINVKHDPYKAFDVDNLIVLCNICHSKITKAQKEELGDYSYNEEVEGGDHYFEEQERYCEICGCFMISKYKYCSTCFEVYKKSDPGVWGVV